MDLPDVIYYEGDEGIESDPSASPYTNLDDVKEAIKNNGINVQTVGIYKLERVIVLKRKTTIEIVEE